MCGTPIIANVTGGLQDQIGQLDDDGKPVEFTEKFGSNFDGKYKRHGVWAKPLWPTARYVQGSIPTPYILDDLCTWEDLAVAMMYWYKMSPKQRELCGQVGRTWAMSEGGLSAENMCNQFITAMNFIFEKWQPIDPVELITTDDYVGHIMPNNNLGFELPKIDLEKIQKEVDETINRL
jgi:hypothetical protein